MKEELVEGMRNVKIKVRKMKAPITINTDWPMLGCDSSTVRRIDKILATITITK